MVKFFDGLPPESWLAEDACELDGLRNAIIGVTTHGYLAYDYEKIVNIFESHGMSREEALEYTDYNVEGLRGDFANWVIIHDYDDIL